MDQQRVQHQFLQLSVVGYFLEEFLEAGKFLEASQRLMINLPRKTHRFFIEPLSETQHIGKSFRKRFINFIWKVQEGSKAVLRHLLYEIRNDCRSTTGKNIRKLLQEYNEIRLADIDIRKCCVLKHPGWK